MEHEVISMVKSCVASRKGGVPLIHIDAEYQEFTGESIPFRKLGFETLGSFICSIPDIRLRHAEDGTTVLNVHDKKVAHITALVENQKSTYKKKQPVFKVSPSYKQRQKRNMQRMSLGKENIYDRVNSLKCEMNRRKSTPWSCGQKKDCNSKYEETSVCHRTARIVDNMLRITVTADTNSDTQVCYTTDDDSSFSFSSDENIPDVEPSLFDHQMIGDDFFLYIAKLLGAWTTHKREQLYSAGLCVSGQTIRQCLHLVSNTNTLASKVILLIGAVDVLEGNDVTTMKAEMLDLIEIVAKRADHVVIVTIPPLVNICHIEEKWTTLVMFNKWLKQFATDYRCLVADTWPLLKGKKMYDFYEAGPRKMVGSSAYVVLWNHTGRKQIIELLQNKISL